MATPSWPRPSKISVATLAPGSAWPRELGAVASAEWTMVSKVLVCLALALLAPASGARGERPATDIQQLGLEDLDPADAIQLTTKWLEQQDRRRLAWAAFWIERDDDSELVPPDAKDPKLAMITLPKVGIHGEDWWRYRIPDQGLIDWPKFFTVLLQAGIHGGMAVEHEDDFWDETHGDDGAELAASRKEGFILAARFLRQYMPGRQ